MNLIPDTPGSAPNYWCTWNLQEAISNVSEGAVNIRNVLSEDFLIGENGWAKTIFPEIRRDLILLLDDGWDIPFIPGQDPMVAKTYLKQNLSSFVLDNTKWPNLQGSPSDRLSQLNLLIKKEGWKGIGVWVAAQEAVQYKKKKILDRFQDTYWKERLEWSKQAGLLYWKVDWGTKCNFDYFRKKLTKYGKEILPKLPIEHAFVTGPFNQFEKLGRVSKLFIHKTKSSLKFSDIFRLYDVCFEIGTSTMLDRLVHAFKSTPKQHTGMQLLHAEDELYLAAASGCCMGIMRHPLRGKNVKMFEAVRAIKWQRIAPPFEASKYPVIHSEEILYDSHYFAPGSFWDKRVINKTIRQGAPAITARGLSLPKVENENIIELDEHPYLFASLNPNGAISIASLGRTNPERGYYTPKVTISLEVPSFKRFFGIFGEFESLILHSNKSELITRIWAQDLGKDSAEDITSRVKIEKNRIVILGELIHSLGTSANPPDDPSEPGIVLKIE